LAKDPLKASVQLNESTNFLTVSIYRQVKALQDQGKSTEAARVAQQAFADESIARAKNIEGSLGTLERGWIGVKDAIIGAKEALLDIGRQQTSGQQVAKLQKDIDSFTEELGGEGISAERFASLDAARQKLIDLQSALQSDIRLQNQSATASAERARAVKDAIKGDEEAARAAKRHAEELKRLIEAGRQLLQGNSLEDAGFSASFIRDMQALQAYAKSAGLSTEQLTQAIDGLLEKQPFAVAQAKALEAVARARADARNAEAKGIEDYLAKQQAAQQQAIDSAKERLSSFKDEEQALQIVRDRNFSLAEAVEMVAIARLEEKRAKLIDDSQAARDLDKEIAARRELLGLIGIRAARDANEKAAKDAADAWQRTVDQAGQGLADALIQGGKSAREYIVGLFRTLTLKPIIQAVVQPLVGATSALLPGLASAGSTAANAGGALGVAGQCGVIAHVQLLIVARVCRVVRWQPVWLICAVVVRRRVAGLVACCWACRADDRRGIWRDWPGIIVCGCRSVARRRAGDLLGQGRAVRAQTQRQQHQRHLRRRCRVQRRDGAVLQGWTVPQRQDGHRIARRRRGRAACRQCQGRARSGAGLRRGLGAADTGGGELHREHQVLDQGAQPGSDQRQAAGGAGRVR
jgi:hypothetical protein